MHAKKSLGQNFLMHARTAERIAETAGLSKKEVVLEIGPGTGMLTRPLLTRAKKVIAIEADQELFRQLEETFAKEIKERKLELISGDIREIDFKKLPKNYSVVANIPYYITGEIMRMFLESKHQPQNMTLLVQKEVAARIAREKKESLLSLSVKAFGEPKYEFTIPRGAFIPAPNVDSAVLTISNISRKNFKKKGSEVKFFALIHAGFAQKRKRLAKNLEAVASKSQIEKVFARFSLDTNARAEDIELSTWLELSRTLAN